MCFAFGAGALVGSAARSMSVIARPNRLAPPIRKKSRRAKRRYCSQFVIIVMVLSWAISSWYGSRGDRGLISGCSHKCDDGRRLVCFHVGLPNPHFAVQSRRCQPFAALVKIRGKERLRMSEKCAERVALFQIE